MWVTLIPSPSSQPNQVHSFRSLLHFRFLIPFYLFHFNPFLASLSFIRLLLLFFFFLSILTCSFSFKFQHRLFITPFLVSLWSLLKVTIYSFIPNLLVYFFLFFFVFFESLYFALLLFFFFFLSILCSQLRSTGMDTGHDTYTHRQLFDKNDVIKVKSHVSVSDTWHMSDTWNVFD